MVVLVVVIVDVSKWMGWFFEILDTNDSGWFSIEFSCLYGPVYFINFTHITPQKQSIVTLVLGVILLNYPIRVQQSIILECAADQVCCED